MEDCTLYIYNTYVNTNANAVPAANIDTNEPTLRVCNCRTCKRILYVYSLYYVYSIYTYIMHACNTFYHHQLYNKGLVNVSYTYIHYIINYIYSSLYLYRNILCMYVGRYLLLSSIYIYI